MKPTPAPRQLAVTLPLLLTLLAGCASTLPASPPVAPPLIPPLPAQARQPQAPAWCSPSCSAGLTTARESWLRGLTLPTAPASPASGPMTR